MFQLSLEDQNILLTVNCNSKITGTYLCHFQISFTLSTPIQKDLGRRGGDSNRMIQDVRVYECRLFNVSFMSFF